MKVKHIIKKPLLREGATLLGLYWLYSSIRWLVARDTPYEAFNNAYKVIGLERQLGIFHEPKIQNWFVQHSIGLVRFANNFYTFGYFPILILTGIILYRFFPAKFQVFKLTFLLGLGFALIGFSLFPLAPPRMLPEFRFIDTQQAFSDGFYNKKAVLSFYNPYAAMPSLHFGWALLVGLAACSFNRRVLQVLGTIYPLTMALVIVITGHHFLLDVVGGGIVVMSAYTIARTAPHCAKEWTSTSTSASKISFNNKVQTVSSQYHVKRRHESQPSEKPAIIRWKARLASWINRRPPA